MTAAEPMYHLCPRAYFEGLDAEAPYVPDGFEREGFIHCTDGLEELVRVGNRYYRHDPRDYVVLTIDRALVQAPIRYEDERRVYPHIYGALDRDSIVEVVPARRLPRGAFVASWISQPMPVAATVRSEP